MKTIFFVEFFGLLVVSLLISPHVFSSRALAEGNSVGLFAEKPVTIPRLRYIVETDAGGDPDD